MTLKLTFEIPKFEVAETHLRKELHKVGSKMATKTRRALKKGSDYDGASLPLGKNGEPIDLEESGTLIQSIKYDKVRKEVAPKGSHPTASARAGSSYGLAQILMSGKDRSGEKIRDEFDLFGGREKFMEDAAALLEKALNEVGDAIIK